MNTARFDSDLQAAVADFDADTYTPKQRFAAMLGAVRAYSNYYPRKRRFGTGSLVTKATAGDTNINICGGPFSEGDPVIVDAFTPKQETVTIETITDAEQTEFTACGTLAITLTASLARDHSKDCFVTPQKPGLMLTANIDTYFLPKDWIAPEQISFDKAIGGHGSVTKGPAFYDAAYTMTDRLSGAGYSAQSNYGPAPIGGYPIAGNPFDNPNGAPNNSQTGEITFQFLASENSMLVVDPPPASSRVLDFFYLAVQSPESVPQNDYEALLSYAKYFLFSGQAGELGGQGSWTENSASESTAANAGIMRSLAQDALKEWDYYIRNRPYVTSG